MTCVPRLLYFNCIHSADGRQGGLCAKSHGERDLRHNCKRKRRAGGARRFSLCATKSYQYVTFILSTYTE
jgi:hypothetical protein